MHAEAGIRNEAFEILRPAGADGVEVRFAPTALGVRRALAVVTRSLRERPIPEEDLQTLELVLAEAMNNVVEHAYLDKGVGEIDLQVIDTGRALRCVICDGGASMPDDTPPEGRLPPIALPISEQHEGGVGWYLIRELSTDLVYVRSQNRNQLTFLVPLTGRAEPS